MVRAFFVKDLRLASKTGTPLPGLGSILALQAIVCFAVGAFAIFLGPPPAGLWQAAASLIGTIAFVLAFIGPATGAAFAAAAEGNPDVAESLSTAPLGPTHFLLGKAALPVVQGLAMQAALLPAWAFLAANGMITMGEALRLVVAFALAVPVAAIGGASRFGGPGSPRIALLLKAAARRGVVTTSPMGTAPGQQTWVALLGMAWMVQVMRGIGVAVPGMTSPMIGTLQDLVRPVLPIVGMQRGALLPLFGIPIPVILLSVLLLGSLGAMRLASTVHPSPRASAYERDWSWRVILGGRSILVLYLAGATWAISPACSAATAGTAALFWALAGYPLRRPAGEISPVIARRELALHAIVPCAMPMLFTTLATGLPGLFCWVGIVAICATAAAAMPPPRPDNDRRALAFSVVAVMGVATPMITAAIVVPGSGLNEFSSMAPVFAAWSWVSLPAAVLSLASHTLGPLLAWSTLEQAAPSLYAVPPWLAAPAAFGLIALMAIARASLKKA